MKRFCLLLLLLPVWLLGGCVTKALWEVDRFARYHEPAHPPHLALFQVPPGNDVLVQYNEALEGEAVSKPRAYWLDENSTSAKNPFKPKFVSPLAVDRLTPIPLVDAPTFVPSPATGLYAVVAANGQDFTLFSGETKLSTHELPVYYDATGRTKQVLLTPLALLADITVVGGVLAVALLPLWWESLNDWTH